MNIEKMREDFEVWVKTQDWNIDLLYRDGYVAWEAQFAFDAWQASRESLVIELPIPKELCGPDGSYMEYFEPEQIEIAIEAAGLKVSS